MTRTTVKMDSERSIIIGLLTNKDFCSQVVPILDKKYLKTRYAKVIAEWVIDYFQAYGTAPGSLIQDMYYERKASLDEDEAQSLAEFLGSLSKEFEVSEDYNLKYELDKAEKYIKIRSLEMLKEKIDVAIAEGDAVKGESAIANYSQVGRPDSQAVSILHDTKEIFNAFSEESEYVFHWPRGIGKILPPPEFGDLIAFLAPPKGRKCLVAGTMVQMEDGLQKPIELVRAGERVLAMTGTNKIGPALVSRFYDNGELPVYKITTKTGRTIEATSNHQFFSFLDGWKSIDTGLGQDSYIAVSKNLSVSSKKGIPLDHAKLIAYLLADGGLTTSSTTFTKKDMIIVEEIKGIVENLGDVFKKARNSDYDYIISKGYNAGPRACETYKLLESYGVKRTKSIYKEIPDAIMCADKDTVAVFLNRLFSCDGCVYNYGIDYCSGSEAMIRQIHSLLLRFDIVSKISSRVVSDAVYWMVDISDQENVRRYIQGIGFFGQKHSTSMKIMALSKGRVCSFLTAIPYLYKKVFKAVAMSKGIHVSDKKYGHVFDIGGKREFGNVSLTAMAKVNEDVQDEYCASLIHGDILYDKIVSIVPMGVKHVYDICVDTCHNFIANDIVAHNSWALDFTADMAAQAGHKVLFVSLEMRKTQLIRRAWQRMTSSPRYDQEMTIPYFKPCFAPDSTLPEDEKHWELYQKTETKQAVDLDSIKEFQDRAKVYYRGGDVRYLTLPAYSATVEDIISQLDNLNYYSNFSPSVLIIDYADILRPSANVKEYRHQLDDIWKKLRALAQARNMLVCTASQGNRGSLGGDVTSESIAEDMRKLAHVSLLVALNSNKEDKARGTLRMKSLVQRDGETAFDEAVVLQCLAMGRFHLDSKPSRQVEF